MSPTRENRWQTPARSTSAAIITAGLLFAAPGASADIVKKEDMLRGVTISHAQCDSTPQTLWLSVFGQDFCVRYYLSTAGGEGPRPLVYLSGDKFWPVNVRTWQWAPSKTTKVLDAFDDSARDIDTEEFVRIADAFSRFAKTTAIYLARIGVDGTSGHHVFRKTMIELQLMNRALDAIKQRHGFEGFHLAGQSGGSRLVGGLVGLRRDIACAVSGSGPLAVDWNSVANGPGRTYFDPVRSIPAMVQNKSLRFLLVTDRADEFVPLNEQTPFAEKARRAGLNISQYFVTATDDHHHGVVSYTQLVAAGCILGKSDAEIATAVGSINARNTELRDERRKEIAALAKKEAASRRGVDYPLTPTAPAMSRSSSKPI